MFTSGEPLRENYVSNNDNLIRRAVPGSDIYGVMEKVAYHLHLEDGRRTDIDNWFLSGRIFTEWTKRAVTDGKNSSHWADMYLPNGALTDHLRLIANRLHHRNSSRSAFDNWMAAMDEVATDIAAVKL